MDDKQRRAAIEGCPGEDLVAWLLGSMVPGAPVVTDAELDARCAFPPGTDGLHMRTQLHERAQAGGGLDAVLGWRLRHMWQLPVVTCRFLDGHSYDLVYGIDRATDRLTGFRLCRSLGDIEISMQHPNATTPDERSAVLGLFERSFGDADPRHLLPQFERMNEMLVMRDAEQLIGFGFSRTEQLSLPVLGPTWIGSSGTVCVDPAYRRLGLADGATMMTNVALRPDPSMLIFHFATPVTIHAALRNLDAPWPGRDVHEMEAAYAAPTATQRAVGEFLADDAGASGYDADNWVLIGDGHPSGHAVEPDRLDPAYGRLFAPVDRTRGDTLLGPFWLVEPPEAWFS